MNWLSVSIFVNLFILSLITIQLTSSASFPNPPQKPPSNASPDEQALFWKLLHNYYAIIARPRFGKRSDLSSTYSKHPLYIDHDSIPSVSSENYMNYMLNENARNANDQPINVDNIYTFGYSDQRRRRRR
ncbi:unnamed protein product [Adineta steineri]|uniref:Uncharacterized protein n=1 Tax=Adineta steineri TaxID=433720 RepID=A0A818ULV4_9BILA|nr:unnamed protein product [Adineta steineri]CAF1314717.1 unnamed protein product [Adineta steineri]CAF1367741.1 unnamed protein product [Adineta steineri]CAF3559145.1 unnamed protein product [Adineta steineri]CAF3640158.1 unnamed protein product [Adineta steineri]